MAKNHQKAFSFDFTFHPPDENPYIQKEDIQVQII